ncbi:MAG TPA: L-arabinose isomerase [Holophaga sp.]|nr:L-arabinose isomerase [Holophaga sp.]
MNDPEQRELWFLTGSPHLYGPEVLDRVARDSAEIAGFLDRAGRLPARVVWKPTLTGPDEILGACLEANSTWACVGVIAWMHTFSPARMWIAGLSRLDKPMAHLHTQYNRDLPWDRIDMDFMNLNQSAHGDREFGFIGARLRMNRKIVVGHWQEEDVLVKLDGWARAACALEASRRLRIARFGGMNMRDVAVTGGDRVEAQIRLGWSVNGYGMGDLAQWIAAVGQAEVPPLLDEYEARYTVAPELRKGGSRRASLEDAARQELGLRHFLQEGGFGAFTTTFEDLHGVGQLPGLACQRLMADGYGFGAEGDWKTAALVRLLKGMAPDGVSFMEDYTYHLAPGEECVLGAHMLEVCPSLAAGRPTLEIHPLGIGGKADPCRLIFEAAPGPAVNATLVDMGGRMRMIVNEVDIVPPPRRMPRLPVASAVWVPRPDFRRGCEGWILAGGGHHTACGRGATAGQLEDFAGMAGIEFVRIGAGTDLASLRNELRWNDAAYRLMP